MHKLLFQALHRPDRSPSQRYRFDQFLPFLLKNQIDCDYSYLIDEKADKYFYQKGHYFKKAALLAKSLAIRSKELYTARNYNSCLIQRESFMLGTSRFEVAISKKIRTIFDFDDAIWQTVVSDANKSLSFLKNGNKTAEIIKASAEIWAGNAYLADYAKQFNSNVYIIPTVVDTDFYKPIISNAPNAKICIGWSGSFSTVPHFEYIEAALLAIKQKYGEKICFKLIGDSNYKNEKLNLIGTEWTKATELQELSTIDIGIMPLPNDKWTQGKCGLKSLVYMSSQIPTIVSPVGGNAQIVTDNVNGLWANSTDEWIEKLSLLIENQDLRKKLAINARQTVEKYYSVATWQATILNRLTNF